MGKRMKKTVRVRGVDTYAKGIHVCDFIFRFEWIGDHGRKRKAETCVWPDPDAVRADAVAEYIVDAAMEWVTPELIDSVVSMIDNTGCDYQYEILCAAYLIAGCGE